MSRSEHIAQQLKLRQLRVFLAVARTGGMAAAAKHLATSQSVVSETVAELETTLGVRLFDRSPQGVEPTPFGHSLLKRSIAVFDDLRTGVAEIEFMADLKVGELRIGTTEPQAGIVVAVIGRLSKQYPRLDFKIVLADSFTLIDRDLRGRQVDLIVAPVPKRLLVEDLETTFLYENRLRVVVAMQSRWARRRRVALSDLINESWCAPPLDSSPGMAFADAFRASGLPMPRLIVSSSAYHVYCKLLTNDRFIGISSDGPLYFDTDSPPLKVLPVEFPASPFTIAILTLRNRLVAPAAQLFIDCARDVTKPLSRSR
jgi:DNA-binding transcriptional LysR family regulator